MKGERTAEEISENGEGRACVTRPNQQIDSYCGTCPHPTPNTQHPAVEKTKRFIMSPEGIGFFKAILESYEEVALLTVLDGKRGDVKVIFPECFEETVDGIIADMTRFGIAFQEVADV